MKQKDSTDISITTIDHISKTLQNILTMKKNVFIIFLSILCTGAVVDHPHLDSRIPTNEIINCLSRSIQESGYIMDLNGTRLPINAKNSQHTKCQTSPVHSGSNIQQKEDR